jgi:ABC-type branched-subunit amino acid transport system substrate-binding protein
VIGTSNVPQSARLGELAEQMDLLCFVANNNPAVWQRRRHIFHIGLPSAQTARAVAKLLQKTRHRRIFLLHDRTEFQSRVATSMEAALKHLGMDAAAKAGLLEENLASLRAWRPDLVYVVFSNETSALRVAEQIRRHLGHMPLLFGRSLLRDSFLSSLGEMIGEAWFVDMFDRSGTQSRDQEHFTKTLSAHGANVATANHAFGWDAMTLCARALKAGDGKPTLAIDYLESGKVLEGVTGSCAFAPGDHNGRSGFGPTTLTRWYQGRLQAVPQRFDL